VTDRTTEFKGLMQAAFRWPASILFPPMCGGCRRLVTQPGALCGKCWPRLRFIERPWCEVLGTPFTHDMGEGIVSPEAIANPPPFSRARSAVVYSGVAREMVQGLKFRDRTELAPWMARWMVRAGADLLADAEFVVPVPLHRRRFFVRRFNQSAELARTICDLSGKRFAPELVARIKATRQQVGLGAREREDNVRGAFRVDPRSKAALAGRRVLVVDDVYTTGTTVYALAKALKRSGAGDVDVLTFARVLPGDFRRDEAETI
jgi:ComF family protein